MAVVMRPYHETVPQHLQAQYDEVDRRFVGEVQAIADKLRQFAQKPIRATHADFDKSRYAPLQRTALALASDLERAIANSGLVR